MNKSFFRLAFALLSIILLTVSCGKDNKKPVAPQFVFKHAVNGFELQKSVMNYTNQAGNPIPGR